MILCVAANPSVDRLLSVDRLIPGSIHRPSESAQVAGGKGLNVARAAHALGGRVTAAALLGGHAGRWVADQLERDGVRLEAAWAAPETRSSLSVAGHPDGLTEFYERGAPVDFNADSVSKSIAGDRDTSVVLILEEGKSAARFWTTDLTAEYVRLNADYHT